MNYCFSFAVGQGFARQSAYPYRPAAIRKRPKGAYARRCFLISTGKPQRQDAGMPARLLRTMRKKEVPD